MDKSYLVYSLAIGWFSFLTFWMLMRIYQFKTFPKTYGHKPDLSLKDLAEAALETGKDLPHFRIVVPAYKETDVIAGTMHRLASLNYPRTHYTINIVTYEDEPVAEGEESTYDVVRRTADSINEKTGIDFVTPILVPTRFDGYFPGDMDSDIRHIGKARGLNYAIRSFHEQNERDERRYYIGRMFREGFAQRADEALRSLQECLTTTPDLSASIVEGLFSPASPDYVGPLTLSSQLYLALDLTRSLKQQASSYHKDAWMHLGAYLAHEAPRFFLELNTREVAGKGLDLELKILPGKTFLHAIMLEIEEIRGKQLEDDSIAREAELASNHPLLLEALLASQDGEKLYQSIHGMNSRWMMVYDADADAPIDILRHLAGRILTDDSVMGFQGPVAPLLNYDEVHPICRMAGLWMGFWHGADYPRLLHKMHWAHPLAGTNWCFHLDGIEQNGKLVRNIPYNEQRRHFLLTFDPKQLTEDLEAGIRHYSDWSVNAEWHPIAEVEQVPPTARAMFSQHTRWALGTLQTMSYILHSNLRWTQKAWYFLGPVRIGMASSGPLITLSLIIAFLLDAFVTDPVLAWWAMLLGFGNLVYFWAFASTFERYFDTMQHAAAVDAIHARGDSLISSLENCKALNENDREILEKTKKQLVKGLTKSGFIRKYLGFRCLDDENYAHLQDDRLRSFVARIEKASPVLLKTDVTETFSTRFESCVQQILERSLTDTASDVTPLPPELVYFHSLVDNASCKAGACRHPRWSRYHTQILLWSIPYMYSSVYPFYKAFVLWSRGKKVDWYKTVRTQKKAPDNAS